MGNTAISSTQTASDNPIVAREVWTLDELGLRHLSWDQQVDWCSQNCRGGWRNHLGAFRFELEQDRVLFILRWC